MIRAVLVDDEEPARSELRYLLAVHPDVEVVGEAAAADDELPDADVVFMDVEMPGLDGIAAASRVRGAALVYVTAHERYAVGAFAVEAFDYLLKPVDPERLARVVDRLRAAAGEPAADQPRIVVVGPAGSELLLAPSDICFVQAEGDYSRVHAHDRSYLSTAPLAELERRLPPADFARVHRSHLVNLGKVRGIRRTGDQLRLQLADAARTEVDVARRQARAVRERLGLF